MLEQGQILLPSMLAGSVLFWGNPGIRQPASPAQILAPLFWAVLAHRRVATLVILCPECTEHSKEGPLSPTCCSNMVLHLRRLFKLTLGVFEWEQEVKFKDICSGGV